ncbi:glycoside hydrolase family 127 protein [Chitinophaga sp. sic0106]|uniref:aceric acid hydrolase n=1 Tax=Chitinophaga sp. sic0106 TaxID=2854785 RepID=UPI001C48EE4A|nr:glycoside hydrolase family 127 protein [Chitinophaga sp. sic0106]MBV7530183.1 glycoside hydrolase family 127 protein [Chitinophaga sp. sic0106]
MKMIVLTAVLLLRIGVGYSQHSLVNTNASPYARLHPAGMQSVQWTKGFWAERFAICKNTMMPQLWHTYTSETMCYAFQNFRIAAGLDTGHFRGPSFHDGDFYKTLESVAAVYAVTKSKQLDAWMDSAIAIIAAAQKNNGYIYTKNIIDQRNTGKTSMFDDKLSFEAYNFGHLMTAACVHYSATGKNSLLQVATRAADFLIGFYNTASPEQARNAICPSHYMGLTELYRTTQDKKYLTLVVKLIDIRGTVPGTDDNSDRAPFRDMYKVAGHAVRANYLFAGAADVFAETGDSSLLRTLDKVWENVVHSKMYVTGGCGALYDGVSVDGTSYNPDTVQKVHQSYGRDYQLPNFSAHNETCANIGNMLWNWRMFLITGDAKYMDVLELALYNSVLSGVSLDGTRFFYTNPLAASADYPYHLRWEGGRQPYISLSNCCPPNTVRTIAEVSDYAYSMSREGLYVNLYGSNHLEQKWNNTTVRLAQESNYPWDGQVALRIDKIPSQPFTIFLRIPAWCKKYQAEVNGEPLPAMQPEQGFVGVKRYWHPGDRIALKMDMPVTLLESNPLVEETRNQVAVKRGPLVYCMESSDQQTNIFDIMLPANIRWEVKEQAIAQFRVQALTGQAKRRQSQPWSQTLYRELDTSYQPVNITLIPYYTWANRGKSDMTVWMPLIR